MAGKLVRLRKSPREPISKGKLKQMQSQSGPTSHLRRLGRPRELEIQSRRKS